MFKATFLLILCFAAIMLVYPFILLGQENSPTRQNIRLELQAADSQIRNLLEQAPSDARNGDIDEAIVKATRAFEIAVQKRLLGDEAIAESVLASCNIAKGNFDEGIRHLHNALQKAVDSKNLVLEADILTSLSSEAQFKGDWHGAIEIARRAAECADQAQSLFEKSRALGVLGNLQLSSGKKDEARISIESALEIDRINQYELIASHLVNQGQYLIATEKFDAAVEVLNQATEMAIKHSDLLSFVLAKIALANIQSRKGKLNEAILLLESIHQGKLDLWQEATKMNRELAMVLASPIPRILLLGGLGEVYRSAGQPEKALPVFEELYTFVESIGLLIAKAAAAKEVADLSVQLKRIEEAIKYYSVALTSFRQLGNESLLSETLVSESTLLIQIGRGQEAIPLIEEVVELMKHHKMKSKEFSAYLLMAEIYQPMGDLAKARTFLEKAQALVKPGPSDPEINNKLLLETYIRLVDIYRNQQDTPKELIAAEKAFEIASLLKDHQSMEKVAGYIERRFKEIKIDEEANKAGAEGRLEDALVLSEISLIFYGSIEGQNATANWQRVQNIPYQLVTQPGGPKFLSNLINEMGSLLGSARYVILDALARYYVGSGNRPDLAEEYAVQLDASLKGGEDVPVPLKASAACTLTLAYAQEGKGALAKGKVAECMSLADKTGLQQTKNYANVANVMAHLAAGDVLDARDSLDELGLNANLPAPPQIRVELAIALAKRKLYELAKSELEKAMKVYLAGGNKAEAATGFLRVAIVLSSDMSDEGKKEQWEYLETAEKLYRESGDVGGEGEVELFKGRRYQDNKDSSAALEHFGKALALAEQAKRDLTMASALTNLGFIYKDLKKFSKAAEYHKRAIEVYHENQNPHLEALSLINLGTDEIALHEPEKALSSFIEAKKVALQDSDGWIKYYIYWNLGNLYEGQGEFEKAMTEFRNAEEVTKEGHDLENLAHSHLSVAELDELLGNWEEASQKAEEALRLFKKLENQDGKSTACEVLGDIFGDRRSSIKDFEKSLAYYQEAERLNHRSSFQIGLLEVYLQMGRYGEALKVAQEGLKECSKDHDMLCQAHTLLSLAEAERKSGDLKGARSHTEQARTLVTKSKDFYLHGRFLYGASNQERAEGNFEKAFSSYKELISLIEKEKGRTETHTQLSLAENYSFIYDELTSTLYSIYEHKTDSLRFSLASQAFEYAETNKARQFAESWGRTFISEMRRGLPAEVQEAERLIISKRRRLQSILAGNVLEGSNKSGDDTRQLNEDLLLVNREYEGFVAKLRLSNSQYAAIAYPVPISIESLPLRRGEVFVECKVTEGSTFVWIVRNDNGNHNDLVSFYKVGRPRSWFEERASILRGELNSGKTEGIDWTVSEQLFDALFPDKIAKQIIQSKSIIFVPDDVLFILPFELLSPGASKNRFIFLSIPTRYYPSAAALRLSRTVNHQGNWTRTFLGIADPVTSSQDDRYLITSILAMERGSSATIEQKTETPNLPSQDLVKLKARGFSFDRLPGTAMEVRDIAALFKASQDAIEVRLGRDATKDKVMKTDLTKYRYLHFATHGILPVDTDVKEPSLVLSYDGTDFDRMFFSVSEILGLHIQADSVVLSACNTGTGNISRAEGVMSLGRAFLAAGASSVTVSLWQVSDESTVFFMEEYYRNLLAGKGKDVALAASRVALFEQGYKQPFYWAPFILVGE